MSPVRVPPRTAGTPAPTRSPASGATRVDATFDVQLNRVVKPHFDGYGAQYNQTVFLPGKDKTAGINAANVGKLQSRLDALHPQVVRVFLNTAVFTDPKEKAAFIRTLEMAQQSGSKVNVTWWHGPYPDPAGMMKEFAGLMKECIVDRKLTCVDSLTVQNEANTKGMKLTQPLYEKLYTLLDADLKKEGIRKDVKLIGGDLLRDGQNSWFQFMAKHMSGVLDGYSVHIYWDYRQPGKMETRLREVKAIVDGLPPGARKPIYVTEFGVRGNYKAGAGEPGVTNDGRPVADTTVSAFQHAWFQALAAQLGFSGTVAWDAYGGGKGSPFGRFSLIGDGHEDFKLRPAYHLTKLFTHAMQPGWSVVHVGGGAAGELVTAFKGPKGNAAVIGMNQNAAAKRVAFTGLTPGTTFHTMTWNRAGGGGLVVGADVTVPKNGRVVVQVPPQAVVALTTLKPDV